QSSCSNLGCGAVGLRVHCCSDVVEPCGSRESNKSEATKKPDTEADVKSGLSGLMLAVRTVMKTGLGVQTAQTKVDRAGVESDSDEMAGLVSLATRMGVADETSALRTPSRGPRHDGNRLGQKEEEEVADRPEAVQLERTDSQMTLLPESSWPISPGLGADSPYLVREKCFTMKSDIFAFG
ncbi:unnamed protein product, partial [Protopolystoma xenopodis]